MSEITIEDIRGFRPVLVHEARDRVGAERQRIGRVIAELLASRPATARPWSGPAALAAYACHTETVWVLSGMARRLATTAQLLGQLAERMQVCLELVRHADRRAADGRGWVSHEGQLVLPPSPGYLDPVLAAHQAREEAALREEIERDLRQAESLARQVDAEIARRLGAAAMPGPGPAPASPDARLSMPSPPPLRAGEFVDPAGAFANAAWWRSLTPEEKGRAIREHPEWVGPRDGLPAWARHEANLALLTRAEQHAAAQLAAARRNPLTRLPGAGAVLERAEHRVAALRAVRDLVSRRDGVPRQLLALGEADGLVTAAVTVGDVDRAEHVATFVGGLTTKVEGDIRRFDSEFTGMRGEAKSVARDGADVAIVAWLGYPAPQWSGVANPRRSVLGPDIARDQADELATFLTGLDAARDTPMHSTLWAHSYGSTLAGHALLRTGAVDDVVLFGSPGVPFAKLEDTGLKPNGLNVLEAQDDLVPLGGPAFLGVPPLSVEGVRRLATMHVKGMPNDLRTSRGHSDYRSPGTLSRRNLVAVAAGRPDLVIPASKEETPLWSAVLGAGPVMGPVLVSSQLR